MTPVVLHTLRWHYTVVQLPACLCKVERDAMWFSVSRFSLMCQLFCSWRGFCCIHARTRSCHVNGNIPKWNPSTCQPYQIIFDCRKLSRVLLGIVTGNCWLCCSGWYEQNVCGIYDDCDNVQRIGCFFFVFVCRMEHSLWTSAWQERKRPRNQARMMEKEKKNVQRIMQSKQHVCEPHDIGNQIICYAVGWLNQAYAHIRYYIAWSMTYSRTYKPQPHTHTQYSLTFISLHTTAYNMSDCDTLIWPCALLWYLLVAFCSCDYFLAA